MQNKLETVQQDKLASVTNGWKQALAVVRSLEAGLAFALQEIEAHKSAFKSDPEKAKSFAKARADLAFAQRYVAAMPEFRETDSF